MGSVIGSEPKPKGWWARNWIWLAIPAVILAWAITPLFAPFVVAVAERKFGPDIFAGAGQFGDQFGAVNALLTAAAFVMLVLGYRQQQRELDEARRAYNDERRRAEVERRESWIFSALEAMTTAKQSFNWKPLASSLHDLSGEDRLGLFVQEVIHQMKVPGDNPARIFTPTEQCGFKMSQYMQRVSGDPDAADVYRELDGIYMRQYTASLLATTNFVLHTIDELPVEMADKYRLASLAIAYMGQPLQILAIYDAAAGNAGELQMLRRLGLAGGLTSSQLADETHMDWFIGPFTPRETQT